ncbi:MAG: NAD(P)/FAD-dependent oxidoreductase, partial [Gemmatimonadota bacterium]
MAERPHVLIVGAGFGGLWAARRLGGKPVDVTLIDRRNFHTFFPLLYQIAAAEVEAVEIAYPVRGILRRHPNVRFFMAEARELDPERRRLHTSRGTFPYDFLVVATGSAPHFFGIPGGDEHAFPLRTLEDGLALRNHILARFEKALQEKEPARRGTLRFVIVGGGPTGVEFAGALAELLFGPLAKDYPELRPDVSVVLVEARDRLLPEMPAKLGHYAARRLERMGVRVCLGARVREVTPAQVKLEGAPPLRTETVTWTAGMQGDPVARKWGLPTTRQGRVRVAPTLQVEGRPRVFVVGDLAHFEVRAEADPKERTAAGPEERTAAGP